MNELKERLEQLIEETKQELRNIYLPHDTVLILSGKRRGLEIAANIIDTIPEQPVEWLDKARLLEFLDQWEAHAIRGMRYGATAYHQGKIALITDLRDWINGEG